MGLRKVAREEDEWGTKDVAAEIGMSRQWVSVAAMSGVLPSYRLSPRGRFHFRKSEILEWYARRTRTKVAAS